jgi:pimeloyl-ACP methyl ester carboxylesterase
MESLKTATDVLEVAYEAHGPAGGTPVILLHGFPYDPRCFDEVAPPLWRHAFPLEGHAALGRAGGTRPRPAAVHERPQDRSRDFRRL